MKMRDRLLGWKEWLVKFGVRNFRILGVTALVSCAVGCILAILYVTSFKMPPDEVRDRAERRGALRVGLGILVITALIIIMLFATGCGLSFA